MYTIGIIGGGFVGSATALIEYEQAKVVIYDIDKTKCKPDGLVFSDLDQCQLIFVCVPTPMGINGECHTDIVEKVIADCRTLPSKPFIVVRSTVPVGFCAKHDVYFMPEFLTEKNWKQDFLTAEEWIIGVKDVQNLSERFKKIMQDIALPNVREFVLVTTSEAESIKYFRNCFLATKVAFCNEFYDFCKSKDVNYTTVSKVAARDPRIGPSHIRVPGPDGHRGFGGTCFPKDMASLDYQMNKSILIYAAIQRNITIDRPEQDWKTSDEFKGRAVV